jgi:DNA-directed RNA polymerase specialized sigma24 family protein
LPSRSHQTDLRDSAKSVDGEAFENTSASADFGHDENLSAEVLPADALLVERCIQGEVAAWEKLYHQCHAPLCASIRNHLGRLGTDSHLVDEMAARVWYALVDHDGKQLTKYNVRRGSVLTFIQWIAKKETANYFRSEQRRLKNEIASLTKKNRSENTNRAESLQTLLTEFIASLTPHERDFCFEYLQISPDDNRIRLEKNYSPANIWQLTRRIYKKFVSYLGPPV